MRFEFDDQTVRGPMEEAEGGLNRQGAPQILQAVRDVNVRVLDVRSLLSSGQEPFPKIMEAADRLGPGQVLQLKAPFEPVPLYGVLGRKGFQHWARETTTEGEDLWEVFFYREEAPGEDDLLEGAVAKESGDEVEEVVGGGSIREIDVRGMEPPGPLEEVLETLESLVYGEVLLVHHHRNPMILFDLLAERGYAYRTIQADEDYWQIRIWRRA